MASWITHARLADLLLAQMPDWDRVGLAVGSVAPDCNVENADWSAFAPPRETTHWMRGQSKDTADYRGFYEKHIHARSFASQWERAYLLGYCAHLIADATWQTWLRDAARVRAVFERLHAWPDGMRILGNAPETFDALKAIFGKQMLFSDIACLEAEYYHARPESVYRTVLMQHGDWSDPLGLLPPGAIGRKLRIMAVAPAVAPEAFTGIFVSRREYETFLICASERMRNVFFQ